MLMKNEFPGEELNRRNDYGSYGANHYMNYGGSRYNSYNDYGNYAYGTYGSNSGGEAGPQRTFKDYLFILRERIWYLLIVFFIVFLGSILYTFNKTKLYTAHATIELLRDDPSVMASASNLEFNEIRTAEDLNTHISKLESITIIQGVEKRLQEEEIAKLMAPYKGSFSFSGCLLYTSPSPRD